MKKKRVLFISSTGGHFNELQQLQPLFEKYDYHIITEKDKSTEKLTEKYGDKIMYLPYGTRQKLFRYIFIYTFLCFKIFGSKIIYIETFANRNRKTATGRLVYPIADLFIVQWEELLKIYPKAVYGGAIY